MASPHPNPNCGRAKRRHSPLPRPPVLAGSEERRVWRIRGKICLSAASCFSPRQTRAPERARRDPDCGSPFSLVTFILAKQKESDLLSGNPRPRNHDQKQLLKQPDLSTSSRRTGMGWDGMGWGWGARFRQAQPERRRILRQAQDERVGATAARQPCKVSTSSTRTEGVEVSTSSSVRGRSFDWLKSNRQKNERMTKPGFAKPATPALPHIYPILSAPSPAAKRFQ